ncbi:MAG: DUF4097 family beta strand repeat protein [Actinomycetia bacterium]|nr:DUF4097 family beta strand repeat protein [Actinomycetes bacterium]MCP4224024.1 DUF4097 family beta strand repeat protein [Actinomycetes bacterium]MCP5033430.1 DUF4097 family beta strand repeat protein [Actinomycetes bacterium]
MAYVEDVAVVPSIRISSTSHRIIVIAENRVQVSVDGDAQVVSEGPRTTVQDVEGRLVVRVPEGTDIVVGSTSGQIRVEGPIGDVAVTTESGRVRVQDAASVDVRTNSSRVQINRVASDCRVRTRSGRVQVHHCGGRADLATKSGRIQLRAGDGPVIAHCTSGRIRVSLLSAHDVKAETVTGRIAVSLPVGVRPYELEQQALPAATPEGYDCTVIARSVSGRVTIDSR